MVVGRGRWQTLPLAAVTLIALALLGSATTYALSGWTVPLAPLIAVVIAVLTGVLLGSLSVETWRSWQALRRTRDQDALLGKIVDNSSDAIITLDAQGIVRTANRSTRSIFGIAADALIGSSLATLVPDLEQSPPDSTADGRSHVREARIRHATGKSVIVEVSTARLQWEQQDITTATFRDITVRKNREEELRYQSLHDGLTGLPNRLYLAECLDTALQDQSAGRQLALLMLDLDGFKEVNDALGHSMGDALMVELGKRLARIADRETHVARIGGDEFALLRNVQRPGEIEELAQQLLLLVEEPISIKGIPISLGTSIGISIYPDHAQDAEALLKYADVALYAAKRKRTRVEFYDASENTNTPRRVEMLTLLRAAVSRTELALHFQPKVALGTGHACEVEALCRWNSPILGNVSPAEFIALAEASDLIRPLTEWTVEQSLIDCRTWHEAGVNLRVAVNLSARHLQDSRLPQWLDNLFSSTRTRPEWLELEITESAIMMDPDRASKILHALHELGVLLSIDDFGTGYSSLAYLRKLPVDRLKIDQAFVTGMANGQADQIIVESIVKLAHGLGLQVVAEGIESQWQYSMLRAMECDIGQGYLIARPMPQQQLLEWCRARSASMPERRDAAALGRRALR